MKKLLSFAFAGSLFAALMFTGCAKDDETQPETSPTGTDPRAAFAGTWAISENSTQTGAATYNVTISDSSNASFLQLAYLYGYHTKIRGTVSGSTMTIPSQVVEGNSVSGTATLANTRRINLTYWVNQGSATDTITAILTK